MGYLHFAGFLYRLHLIAIVDVRKHEFDAACWHAVTLALWSLMDAIGWIQIHHSDCSDRDYSKASLIRLIAASTSSSVPCGSGSCHFGGTRTIVIQRIGQRIAPAMMTAPPA